MVILPALGWINAKAGEICSALSQLFLSNI